MSKTVRVSDPAYALIKAYAEDKDIPIACAIGEVMACPLKCQAVSDGVEIPIGSDNEDTEFSLF